MSNITTSQTIGPFPDGAWAWAVEITSHVDSTVPQVRVQGAILDGDGVPIDDAWAEAWIPDSVAAESAQAIPGYRRASTVEASRYSFWIPQPQVSSGKPAAYVTVFARGLGKHQFTAVFLEDDPALAKSTLLEQLPIDRRDTLIARKQADGSYLWDIHLQGERETIFFDYA